MYKQILEYLRDTKFALAIHLGIPRNLHNLQNWTQNPGSSALGLQILINIWVQGPCTRKFKYNLGRNNLASMPRNLHVFRTALMLRMAMEDFKTQNWSDSWVFQIASLIHFVPVTCQPLQFAIFRIFSVTNLLSVPPFLPDWWINFAGIGYFFFNFRYLILLFFQPFILQIIHSFSESSTSGYSLAIAAYLFSLLFILCPSPQQ